MLPASWKSRASALFPKVSARTSRGPRPVPRHRGLGLSCAVAGGLVAHMKNNAFKFQQGDVSLQLAQSYGFCWGVERAVQMAYEARKQYPTEKMWITNEIIHNPTVNQAHPYSVPFCCPGQFLFYLKACRALPMLPPRAVRARRAFACAVMLGLECQFNVIFALCAKRLSAAGLTRIAPASCSASLTWASTLSRRRAWVTKRRRTSLASAAARLLSCLPLVRTWRLRLACAIVLKTALLITRRPAQVLLYRK